jgi:hypothetical protein
VLDRRGRKGRSEAMLPKEQPHWEREIWVERDEVAKTEAGISMLREAAKALGLSEEAVDEVLHKR